MVTGAHYAQEHTLNCRIVIRLAQERAQRVRDGEEETSMYDDNPTENRNTASHALLSAVGATFGGGAGLTLIRVAIRWESLPLSHIVILVLTTAAGGLLLSTIWPGRPDKKWPLNRYILWISVLAVATTILATTIWPWYWHWAFPNTP